MPLPRLDVRPRRLTPHRTARGARAWIRARVARLPPVSVAEWGPFVFANLDPEAAPRSRSGSARFPDRLAEHGVDRRPPEPLPALGGRRVRGELEGVRRELPRVLPLRNRPSEPRQGDRRVTGRVCADDRAAGIRLQVGPPKNGGGGVYDAVGEVDRGLFVYLFPNTVLNAMPGQAQSLDRADPPSRPRADLPVLRLLPRAGHRRGVARRLPGARDAGG